MIKVEKISKRFSTRWAVRDVSFEVAPGEVIGYLGPNGAGKTTTLRMLLGMLTPTSGTAEIFGLPVGRASTGINKRIGVVLESGGLYSALTVRENLEYFGRIAGLNRPALTRRIEEVLESVGLLDRVDDKAASLSKGLAQRAALARALLADPDLLLLDEPTSGLDPVSQRVVRGLVSSWATQGKTVFFSSHNLHEVEEVAGRVFILNAGCLVEASPLAEILERHAVPKIDLELERIEDVEAARDWTRSLPYVSSVKVDGRRVIVQFGSAADANAFRDALVERRIPLHALRDGTPSLEDVYVRLVADDGEPT